MVAAGRGDPPLGTPDRPQHWSELMSRPVARLHSIVLDCPDPDQLARFYQDLLGYVVDHAEDGWVSVTDPDNRTQRLSFQRIDNYQAPTWPEGRRPQQLHLDLFVD